MTRFIYIALLLAVIGCKHKTGSSSTLPTSLTIGFVPSEEAERMVKNLEPVTTYLSKDLGMPVNIFKGSDYTAIIEAMRGDKLDIGIFGPFSYVLASSKAGAQALVAPGSRDGRYATYNSLIVAHRSTGLEDLESLMNAPSKYSLSFSDPASTSGHLVPRGHMLSMGLKPEEHFTDIVFSGSHTATLLAIATHKIDVAGCSYTVYNKMIKRGMLDTSQVRILWKSYDLPVDLVTVRGNLSETFKEKLRDSYKRMADEAPETAGYFYEEWNDSTLVYLPTQDSIYGDVRKLSEYVTSDLDN